MKIIVKKNRKNAVFGFFQVDYYFIALYIVQCSKKLNRFGTRLFKKQVGIKIIFEEDRRI